METMASVYQHWASTGEINDEMASIIARNLDAYIEQELGQIRYLIDQNNLMKHSL